MATMRCPCLSGNGYDECCGVYHHGEAKAPTAERLMRSRYSAFAVGDARYLLASWHPRTRPVTLELDPEQRWTRLDIVRTQRGGMLDTEGIVEFVAYSRVGGERREQREVSRFVRQDAAWYYLDAITPT